MHASTAGPDRTDELRLGRRNAASRRSGGCWPTPQQELLLQAAFGRRPDAIVAWRHWAAGSDLDHLDHNSVQVLSDVYRNLQQEAPSSVPEIGRLKGIYRQNWYRNHITLRDAALLVNRLADAGVQVLLVAGAALALRYQGLAARPINGLEVLVKQPDASRALELLCEAGWRPDALHLPVAMPRFIHLVDQNGQGLVLHRCLLAENGARNNEEDLWRSATTVEWPGARAVVLDPADQLLHVCVLGVNWRPVPELRWIADAAAILDVEAAALDWNRVVHVAQRYRLSLPLLRALEYLREQLGAVVPAEPMDALARCRPSLRERIELRVLCQPPGPILGGLPRRGLRWWRITQDRGWLARAAGFPAFLAEDLGCRGPGELARLVFVEAVRRTAGRAIQTRPGNTEPST